MVGNKGSFCVPTVFFCRQIDVRVKSAFQASASLPTGSLPDTDRIICSPVQVTKSPGQNK